MFKYSNAATPIVNKIYASYSIVKEAVAPLTKPSLEHEKRSGRIYYVDNYNDLPWRCSCGTNGDDGIWLNHTDTPGLVMSSLVWLMIGTFISTNETFQVSMIFYLIVELYLLQLCA